MPVEIPESVTEAVENLGKDALSSIGKMKIPRTSTTIGDAVGKLWKSTAKARSIENAIKETPAGESIARILKEDYEYNLDRARHELRTTQPNLLPHEIESKAHNIARVASFGKNDALAVQHIKWAEKTHGLQAAQNLANYLHVYLGDTVTIQNRNLVQIGPKSFQSQPLNPGTPGAGTRDVSILKRNVIMNRENQVPIDDTAIYKHTTPLEESLYNFGTIRMLSDLAVKHLGTPFNTLFGTPLTSLVKGLAEVITPGGYRNTRDALLDTGIFAQTSMEIYRDSIAGANSLLGPIAYKIMHSPGFTAERMWTIAFAGAAGKHTALRLAEDLVDNPKDRFAILSLKELGIEAGDVLKQNGKLTKAQLDRAIYRYVDNRVFLNRKLDRSYIGQATPFGRIATMYHGYTAAQGHLLQRELLKAWKSGNIGNIVQLMTTLGVIFPLVGHQIGGLERLARGQSFNDPKYDAESWAHKYLDDMASMGGFSMGASYINGALTERLANQIIGPVGNVAVNTVTDSFQALIGKKSWKVPARDVLYYSFPDNLGKILAHQVLPTTAEERAKHPHIKKLKSGLKGVRK